MPRKAKTPLVAPVFGEPVFNEGVPTPDPTQFKVSHPSDSKLYKQIQDLLTKDTVSFPASTAKPGDLYSLQQAWGPHGDEVIQNIQQAKQISFHALGDTGASSAQKYANAIRVSDMVTNDYHTSSAANTPAFLYHLGDVVAGARLVAITDSTVTLDRPTGGPLVLHLASTQQHKKL